MEDDLRAITIRQPWCWAVVHAGKDVENRSRGTGYRGALLIHAAQIRSRAGDTDPRIRAAWGPPGNPSKPETAAEFSAVLAVAQLVDSHPDDGCCRPWGDSSYAEPVGRRYTATGPTVTRVHHLVLADVTPLPEPVPWRGALGLWRPPPELAAAVRADVLR